MIQAMLFDLDGTLVNSDPLHYQAWRGTLAHYGLEIDEAFYAARISGRVNMEIVPDLLPELSTAGIERFIEQKESLYRTLATQLIALPGLSNLLAWAGQRQLKLALVTNAPRQNARFMLEALKLEKAFAKVVLAEDVAAGKPDPAPYRAALKVLGITAKDALAFEDSPSGIQSAVGAGLPTVGIASTHDPGPLYQAGASLVIPDFTDPKLWITLQSIR